MIVKTASDTFLFAGLDPADVERILHSDGVTAETFKPGEIIMSPEVSAHRLGILLEGTAQVFKTASEAQLLISLLQPGQLLGAVSLFAGDSAFVTTIRAKQKCRILFFSESCMRTLLQNDFRIVENYIRYLTHRIRFLTARLESIASPTAEDKLYQYLLQNAEDGTVHLAYSLTALASALGIGRASLYRAIDALERAGKIVRNGKTIFLTEVL